MAVAIGLHNIPEGISVALPVYYATGSRWRAFGYALLSGVAEPVGALIGWLALRSTADGDISPTAYGVVFGLVGGMMTYLCFHELIPTALRYDPRNEVTTRCIVGGMAVMALSLVLFQL